MYRTGYYNTLTISRETGSGLYLSDDEENEILLPLRYVTPEMKTGKSITVFVYRDSEDRPVAVTDTPLARAGEVALLKVKEIATVGAFMEWGLPKDLLVPFREQKEKMLTGHSYLVYVTVDPVTDRLIGSSRLNNFIGHEQAEYTGGETVELIIYRFSPAGIHVIVDHRFFGILYRNEVFRELAVGDKMEGFVRLVRPDGKIDCSLRPIAMNRVETLAGIIHDKLKQGDGFLALGDESEPEEIYRLFGESKKVFKKAVGHLYRQKLITMSEKGIRLAEKK